MNFKHVFQSDNLLFRHLCEEEPDIHEFRMHMHDWYEMLYFIKGNAEFVVETNVYPLEPHTLIITRPMESHQLRILSVRPSERMTLHFPRELIDPVDPSGKLTVPFSDRPLGIHNAFHSSEFGIAPIDLLSAMEVPAASDAEKQTNIIVNLYALLAQMCEAFSRKSRDPIENERSPVYEVVRYINQNLFEPLSVKSIAAAFYMNESHLSRLFSKATGIPVWQYVIDKRLLSARKAIRAGTPATVAYYQNGFQDYSSFYRMYVKKFKTTPKEDYIKRTVFSCEDH